MPVAIRQALANIVVDATEDNRPTADVKNMG